MADKDFVVKNGLIVNTAFSVNSTQITLSTVNSTSNGLFANATLINFGNSTSNATINTTAFSGTAANATLFASQSLTTVQGWITSNASAAYSNAITNSVSQANALVNAYLGAQTNIELSNTVAGDRISYIDFHTDDTYTDYSMRIGGASGNNGNRNIITRGTGNLTIQTTEAGPITLITNNSIRAVITAGGNTGLGGCTAPTTALTVTGAILASGEITAYSDERLKTEIKTIEGALEKIKRLRGVNFVKDGKYSTGVIAQEVQKVIPEVVDTGHEYLSVAYSNLVGLLIEAIKELSAKVDHLESK